ncbi:PrsW family intramembrane metalloprotease [Glaciibacter psychrotolerans]|uniref:RsiW-degrading membrane proteinase PrsW (M82 family) n=1 Tax=Glaciibacter psychrotolerans TaxID=670054 RepID=A0A7Z0ED03_9MICO|nr:PrsW family intramembrane metalloprotease [Leifsonia psychrotolerans]NYJ18749.1 RsiW-degrading membrane proteinase PrsW (M82 family) [Leifsonia psychrotolerans]
MSSTIQSPILISAAHPHHRHGWWWKTFLVGVALWGITIGVTAMTLNSNLIPTLILLGSFLVPFCVVLFVMERTMDTISTMQILLAFFVGGMCGVLGASLLEVSLQPTVFTYVGVGFIEEFVKGVILVIIGWKVMLKTAGQGALLGATVGAGFAAFESAGYALNAAITSQGLDLVSLLQTEVLRALLTPVGHVLWTAILGAALFGAARGQRRYRVSFGLVGAFVGVALLHALWDSMSGITAVVALLFTGTTVRDLTFGFIPPGSAQEAQSLASVLYVLGVIIAAALGVVMLWLILRFHRRADRRREAALSPMDAEARVLDPAREGDDASEAVAHE